MKKKLFFMLLVGLMSLFIVACTSSQSSGENNSSDSKSSNNQSSSEKPKNDSSFPNGPVKLIVPYGPGGGTDLSARILQPFLEEELGVPVVVENIEGGGGWVGWSELARSKADGYTIGYMNMPNVIVGYKNPEVNRKETLESFDFLSNHVVDKGVIAIRADEDRFKTIEELIAYAKDNELTVNASGVGSANHFVGSQLNQQLGTKFNFVHMNGVGEAIPAVLGGHVDVLIAGVGETMSNIKDGEFLPLAVFGDNRVEALPDVPTVNESVGAKTNPFLFRPIAGPAGLDPEVKKVLEQALVKAISNEQHVEKIAKTGMEVDTTIGDELNTLLSNLETDIDGAKDIFGW
jgi:tripartite-type tricarboxylate transporter receptor subunit TctC